MRNYIMRIENASHLISVLTHFFPPTVAYCCVLYASLVLITHNIPGFPGFTYIGQLIIPSLSRELIHPVCLIICCPIPQPIYPDQPSGDMVQDGS